MFIYHSLKMIYTLVPKTGTNSFWRSMKKFHKEERLVPEKTEPVFEMESIKHLAHLTARQARTLINKEIWDSYEKVGFVRHPYDWIVSYYNIGEKGIITLGENAEMPFEEFLQTFRMTPFYWFTDTNGDMLIDTVYRTEDMKKILDKYGCKYKHENKTPENRQAMTVKMLTKEHKEIIDERFVREWAYYDRV